MNFDLIDTKTLAARLDTSEITLSKMRCQGTGPRFVKIGRSVKYRWSDVEAWLERCERSSTSEAA